MARFSSVVSVVSPFVAAVPRPRPCLLTATPFGIPMLFADFISFRNLHAHLGGQDDDPVTTPCFDRFPDWDDDTMWNASHEDILQVGGNNLTRVSAINGPD